MKTISFVSLLVLCFCRVNMVLAQEHKITVKNAPDGKLSLVDFSGDLTIKGYEGDEIIISAPPDDDDDAEKTKGLKPVYSGGTDNTGLGLNVEQNGNQINILCLLPITKSKDYTIKIPNKLSLQVRRECERSYDISVEDMKNSIEIKNCQDIRLKNISGPLSASTISGDINADFGEKTDGPVSLATVSGDLNLGFGEFSNKETVSISAVSGDIHISLPSKTAADLSMNTVSGDIHSDIELPKDTQKNDQLVGSGKQCKLNGGGFELTINTVSGDIQLKKKM